MEFKLVVILILALILGSLGKALFHLSSGTPGNETKMAKALAWRVGLSVFLFLLLFVAHHQGWIDRRHL